MVARPVKSTSLVLSLSAMAQFEEHRSVITYVRSLLFGCLTDVNPALSPYKRTSRLGFTTSPWTTACSGSCGVLMLGRPSASFQSSRRNTEGRRRPCARQSDPATHRPNSPNTATGICLVMQPSSLVVIPDSAESALALCHSQDGLRVSSRGSAGRSVRPVNGWDDRARVAAESALVGTRYTIPS